MIQGLGQKHQPMLPSKEEEEALEIERVSNERVESWANAVSADGVMPDEDGTQAEEDDRESRFDRPLKEIRVGESPSRPWGISVPIFDPPLEERSVSPPPAPVSAEHLPKISGKCPFGHGQAPKMEEKPVLPPASAKVATAGKCPFEHGNAAREAEPVQERATKEQHPPLQPQPAFIQSPEAIKAGGGNRPQMVFTGPVFIGYPIEQAMALMQQWKSAQ